MENNPDIHFILKNKDVLKAAYPGKCVLVIGQRVARTFDNTIDAMMYRNDVLMKADHAFADFSSTEDNIIWHDGK